MLKNKLNNNPIPLSVALAPTLEQEHISKKFTKNKKRLVYISLLAIFLAAIMSCIAKVLVLLINFITNLSFMGTVSLQHSAPADSTMGWWIIIVPVIGGLLVGIMAFYGSAAIRGHGIPEAMEQILTNKSRIKPAITFLKPISSAISIGTGGPFGAEGPIIATGGALGSSLGQLLKITHNERKILLSAGATAGMSAIFGTPIAAIFLAVELLLFEFSPRSIIPVALACITGAAGHHFFFGTGPVFPMLTQVEMPSNAALAVYSGIGLLMGVISIFVTKIVYFIEDLFEKIPLHWMWYPAIGGLFVGIIGYYSPHTLGVGYDNIVNILSGTLTFQFVLSLCILKFLSWAIALGSGTSGGTLAPLFTIGGALGILIATGILYVYPEAGITLSLAALVSMAALFAGSSRALLTSIVFALESTAQSNALLPLLAACAAAYCISFFFMENTIMTEKIARRGIKTPDSYEPDLLEKVSVSQVMEDDAIALNEENTIEELRQWLKKEPQYFHNYFIVTNDENVFKGILKSKMLFSSEVKPETNITELLEKKELNLYEDSNLRTAVEMMSSEKLDVLPILSKKDSHTLVGILNYKNILTAYKTGMDEDVKMNPSISLKRTSLKMIVHGQKLFSRN